jgi:osmotically-inducible protein OsmY
MFGRNQIADKDLAKTVNQRLARAGASSSSRIAATIQQGTVTLTGTLQYPGQRSPIVKSLSGVPGVTRVVDLMKLAERKQM